MMGFKKGLILGVALVLSGPARARIRLPGELKEAPGREADAAWGAQAPQYGLRLSLGRPTFSDKLLHYEEFYGKAAFMAGFAYDWKYFHRSFLSLGLGAQLSLFNKKGNQLQRVSAEASLQPAEGKLSLTLLPYQLLLTGQLRPFGSGSWVSVDVWAGYEELYYQEVRVAEGSQAKKAGQLQRGLGARDLGKAASAGDEKSIVNSGWNAGLVTGFAFNILLSPLNEKGSLSMQRALGLGGMYLSPFYERVTPLGERALIAGKKTSPASFARQTIGLGLTFTTSS